MRGIEMARSLGFTQMLIFQYGSNMSSARLNHTNRLNGDAKFVSIAKTVKKHKLAFNVLSKSNNCAAADIVEDEGGLCVMGVLYEIPDALIMRETAQAENRKSLDAIEGQGGNYDRINLEIELPDGTVKVVTTYVVKRKLGGFKTSEAYAQHIIDGLLEHSFPQEYFSYVVSTIEENNPELQGKFKA